MPPTSTYTFDERKLNSEQPLSASLSDLCQPNAETFTHLTEAYLPVSHRMADLANRPVHVRDAFARFICGGRSGRMATGGRTRLGVCGPATQFHYSESSDCRAASSGDPFATVIADLRARVGGSPLVGGRQVDDLGRCWIPRCLRCRMCCGERVGGSRWQSSLISSRMAAGPESDEKPGAGSYQLHGEGHAANGSCRARTL